MRLSNIRDSWDIVMVISWDFLWKIYFFKNHSKVEELSENYWHFIIISRLEYQFVFDLYSICHLLKFESTRIDLLIFWICNRFSNIRDIWDIVMVLSWDFLWKKYFFKNHSKVEELSENYWHFRIISRLEFQFVFDLYSICHLLKFESTRHDLLVFWICMRFSNTRDIWDNTRDIWDFLWKIYFFKNHSKVEELSENYWHFRIISRLEYQFVFDLYSICQLLKFESTRHDLLIVWICRDSWDIVMVIKKISCEKYTFFKKHSKVEKLSDNCWQFEIHYMPKESVCIRFVFDLSFT